ncbi:MAG: hypothetical protein HKN51_01695 [Saprospiraceae bacterium]|nr:hypothetical protein [Saprospiraceae bacterium]
MTRALFLLVFILLVLSCKDTRMANDQLNLESKLRGKWVARAFDGELHEVWGLNNNGWMQQQGFYIEKNDTSYAATTQIQKVGDDIILFSVILNSNPKIFKSVKFEENEIIFKNDDYKNPYEVKYEFLSNENYRRTITGRENDSLVVYEFNFEKTK